MTASTLIQGYLARLGCPARPPSAAALAELQFRSAGGVVSGSPAYVAPETITSEPIDGHQIGGCGFWNGRGHTFTYSKWKCLPSNANGPGRVHACTTRSCAS